MLVPSLAAALLGLAGPAAAAGEEPPRPSDPARRWSLTALAGQADDNRFVEILTLRGGDFEPSYIGGLALARHLGTTSEHLHWEAEASGYRHSGIESHFEANLALVSRWTRFPWDRHLDTSVAFGQGFSWASERPLREDETRRFLHHLLAEVEVAPERRSPLALVLRVHHRSGVFGLYGASGGANYITLGLRYRF